MSYIVNGNFTLTNMKKGVYKSYLTPSKCKKYVLWDAWNAIFSPYHDKIPMYIFLYNQICKGPLAQILTMSYIVNGNFT